VLIGRKKNFLSPFWAPLLGGLIGVLYSILDEETVKQWLGVKTPGIVVFYHNVLDWFLPVILGILIGLGINVMRKQVRLNKALSLQNVQFQRDLLVTTLISQFLHEIRNPIHNLSAALEEGQSVLPPEQNQIIQRNLERFEEISSQYKGWDSIFNHIDPRESFLLQPWLEVFIADKIQAKFREINVHFSQEIEAVKIKMHPILLEQSLVTLFSNAFEELSRMQGPRGLRLSVHWLSTDKKIELKIANTSRGFSAEVLREQGRRPVASRNGTGLGLLLLRKIVEQVEGEMILANKQERAEIRLLIPGEKA